MCNNKLWIYFTIPSVPVQERDRQRECVLNKKERSELKLHIAGDFVVLLNAVNYETKLLKLWNGAERSENPFWCLFVYVLLDFTTTYHFSGDRENDILNLISEIYVT